MRWAKVVKVARGLAPQRRIQRVFSKSGGGVGVPNVCVPVIGIVAYVFIFILGRLEPIADPPAT
jgi:hypothetical protein